MSLFPLHIKGARVTRRGQRLVGPVDLSITRATGITIVIGPNGSGKTTLLRMLHGLARVKSGTITWAKNAPEAQSFVFQQGVMLLRSVRENIAYPLLLRQVSKRDAYARADEWAMRVGLEDALTRYAPDLSGGERQKLALARALITKPELVFLDEPCASLDGRSTREIETLLRQAAEQGTRLIMSTHDMGQARRLADEVVFLMNGEVRENCDAETFFTRAESQEARAFLRGDILE